MINACKNCSRVFGSYSSPVGEMLLWKWRKTHCTFKYTAHPNKIFISGASFYFFIMFIFAKSSSNERTSWVNTKPDWSVSNPFNALQSPFIQNNDLRCVILSDHVILHLMRFLCARQKLIYWFFVFNSLMISLINCREFILWVQFSSYTLVLNRFTLIVHLFSCILLSLCFLSVIYSYGIDGLYESAVN